MRISFMGTPAFAIPVLAALHKANHQIVGVHTKPDKPVGRGKRLAASPVKQWALKRGVPVLQPASLKSQRAQADLESLAPDVVVVVAYGLFLPGKTLRLPPLGCLNVHPSLLPNYRGPSPVASAILNGDTITGVTIMKLDEGMDTGPIVAQRETAIGAGENAEALTARLFDMGASLLVDVLPDLTAGRASAIPQDESEATVTRLLSKEDGEIDWGLSAARIARQVLAYYPWPGSFTRWQGRLLKIVEASTVEQEAGVTAAPGVVVSLPDGGLGIGASQRILAVRRLQLEGRRAVGTREFATGYPHIFGATLGT